MLDDLNGLKQILPTIREVLNYTKIKTKALTQSYVLDAANERTKLFSIPYYQKKGSARHIHS